MVEVAGTASASVEIGVGGEGWVRLDYRVWP